MKTDIASSNSLFFRSWHRSGMAKLEVARLEREGPNCLPVNEAERQATANRTWSHAGDGLYFEVVSVPWGVSYTGRIDGVDGRKYVDFYGSGEGVAVIRFPTPLLQYQSSCDPSSRRYVPPADHPEWTCGVHVRLGS